MLGLGRANAASPVRRHTGTPPANKRDWIPMSLIRCPTCAKPFDPQAARSMPFCSERCRSIDLNRWLSERISIPLRELSEDGLPDRVPDEDDQE